MYNLYDKTPLHIFNECDAVKCLWGDLFQCFQNNLILPTLTPQVAIFRILESASNGSLFKSKVFINHILLYLSYMCLNPEKKIHEFKFSHSGIPKSKAGLKRNCFN